MPPKKGAPPSRPPHELTTWERNWMGRYQSCRATLRALSLEGDIHLPANPNSQLYKRIKHVTGVLDAAFSAMNGELPDFKPSTPHHRLLEDIRAGRIDISEEE